jgi:hypothetical protein
MGKPAATDRPRLTSLSHSFTLDLVICCRGRAEEALATMRIMMTKLKLTVNETKTRVSKLPEEKFDYLGYTFGRCYSTKTGRAYLGTVPATKRVIRICEAISRETGRDRSGIAEDGGDASGFAVDRRRRHRQFDPVVALPADGEAGIGFLKVDLFGITIPRHAGGEMIGGIEQPGVAGLG